MQLRDKNTINSSEIKYDIRRILLVKMYKYKREDEDKSTVF